MVTESPAPAQAALRAQAAALPAVFRAAVREQALESRALRFDSATRLLLPRHGLQSYATFSRPRFFRSLEVSLWGMLIEINHSGSLCEE